MLTPTKIAICLVRKSSEAQDLDEQSKDLFNYAIRDGWNENDIKEISHTESAIKLSDEERQGLIKLYSYLDNPKYEVDTVYCWELSRISRLPESLYKIRNALIERKINLKCYSPSFSLLNEDKTLNSNASMTFGMFVALCETEMLNRKARFRRTRIKNAREGKYTGGFIKYGYNIDDNNAYKINNEEAKFIQLIFNLYENGLSEVAVTRELQERGYTNIRVSNVRHILVSKEYTGKSDKYGFERIYPVIITPEQFNKCREIAKTNNRNANKTKNIYYAKGLIKCTCGKYWGGMKSSLSYFCFNRYNNKDLRANYKDDKICNNKQSISINVLDSLLWHIIPYYEAKYITEDAENDIQRMKKEIEILEDKIESTQKSFDKVKDLRQRNADVYSEGERSKEKYEAKKLELLEQEREINKKKTKWQNEINRLSQLISNIQEEHRFWDDVDISCNFQDKMDIIINIEDEQKRYDLIHKHIKEISISEHTKGRTKKIEITLMNGLMDCYYYDYKSKEKTIWFYTKRRQSIVEEFHHLYSEEELNAPDRKAVLWYEYLNRFNKKKE